MINNKYFYLLFSLIILLLQSNIISGEISEQCQNDITPMVNMEASSIPLWINTGRSPNSLGNIDSCLQLPRNESHYCVYQTSFYLEIYNMSYPYLIGLCFPPSCNTLEDIEYILYNMTMGLIIAVPGTNSELHCYTEHDQTYTQWRTGSSVMLAVCIVFGILIVIGTGLECYRTCRSQKEQKDFDKDVNGENHGLLSLAEKPNEYDDNTPKSALCNIFLAFSLIRNYNSFMEGASTKRHFDALDGIRTVSTIWVLLGHSLVFSVVGPGFDNSLYIYDVVRNRFSFQAIPAGEFAVDVFFMLSGFLVAHALLSQLDSKRSRSILFWLKYVIHRFIRLSPLYYFLLFMSWLLLPAAGSGPLWYMYNNLNVACDKYWWTNLLYINNLDPPILMEECVFAHAWYLANDMQFYLIAPFILIAFRYRKSFGYILISVFLAICFTSNIWLSLKYNIKTFFDFSFTSNQSFATDIYQKPWTRIGPYVVGMGVAFLYTQESTKNLYDNRIFRSIAYVLALGITMFFSYIPYSGSQGNEWTNLDNALFNAFSHTMFTVGLSLFMIATFYGYGGILAWFFKLGIFRYFSKLTYSTYLIHPIVMFYYVFSRSTIDHYSTVQFAWLFVGNCVMSFAAAFVVHLCIEKPFVNLERIVFPPSQHNQQQQQQQQNELINNIENDNIENNNIGSGLN